MALPATWPPRVASSVRSIRFYLAGTATANFNENAYIFADQTAADTFTPLPLVPPGGERVNVTVPPTPWGSGRNAGDANPDPAAGAVPPPPPKMIWCRGLRIAAIAGDLEISFDGTNVHGFIKSGDTAQYSDRYESGIAVRASGAAGTFRIEAW